MVYVKIVETSRTGRIILPSYFPISVLRKAVGEEVKIINEYTPRMTDIVGYLIKDGDRFVIKPVSQSDRKAFLTSFTMRIEDLLEATNDFTHEYNIYPSDIVLDGKSSSSQQKEEEQENLQIIDEYEEDSPVQEHIYSDIDTMPIDLFVASKELTSVQEESVLKTSINHYLIKFGLRPIDEESNKYPLHYLSTKGDTLLGYALLDYFTNRKVLKQLLTNESMKLALGRMGYHEFLEANTHLAGTFFEVIYACAMLQNKNEVRQKMEKVLVGEEAFKTKLPKIKFKE